ncbi:MAG TPA: CpaF family protein [Candidatus Deferrimicrobiaceae bacterium]
MNDLDLPDSDKEIIRKGTLDEIFAFGPITCHLDDPSISEIMVNGKDSIYVEREGKVFLSDAAFLSEETLRSTIDRMVSVVNRRLDESSPFVDARLADGSRVNAIIPPVSLIGPCLTIRKFRKEPYSLEELIRIGTLTEEASTYLREAVVRRRNMIISGGTGSGKTTLLNALSQFIPDAERIITIEDAAEIRLLKPHVVRLEARPPNIEGNGAITIRDLVRNSLRMRPDRIVVGECRGGEAIDMLQAMNTGHDGSLTTGHANSPRDMMRRLETMVLLSGVEIPVKAIREQIASAIDVIVHICRMADGRRAVTSITEVTGMGETQILLQDIFRSSKREEKGCVLKLDPTGVPSSIFLPDEARWE